MKTLVEIVCCSAEDAVLAQKAGAKRIELCTALALGGLTPSLGTVRLVKRMCKLPVMAMVRPRPSGFCYSDVEFDTMLADVDDLLAEDVEGLVFGVLTANREIDTVRMKRLVKVAGRSFKVCHRAFDLTPDPLAALEQLIDLGMSRVLTGGQRASAVEGVELIKKLQEAAAGRIEILPGGGLRASNVGALVAATGVTQVHLAPQRPQLEPSVAGGSEIKFGGPSDDEGSYLVLDELEVKAVVAALA